MTAPFDEWAVAMLKSMPERAQADDEVLGALNEVTNWRREGDVLVLIGTRTMRFRLQTN